MKRCALLSLALLLAASAAAPAGAAEGGVKLRFVAGVYSDPSGAALKAPEGIAAAAGGRLVVADTGNGRIVEYAVAEDRIEAKTAIALPELPSPLRPAIGASGEIYVLDGKLRRIGRVGAGGEFLGYVELPPQAVPRSVKTDRGGKLWVLDVGRGRVLSLGPTGAVESEIELPDEPSRSFFSDLALGARGEVYVLDSVERRVLVARTGAKSFEPLGATLEEDLDFATSLAADNSGRLFVADQSGGGIVVLGADGSFRGRQSAMGWKDGMLRYPTAIAIEGGKLFVADRGNNRVEVFATGP
jgi:DNA-binding beta-propeller fold protein YncE